jgi:polyribonucleotide 5'-hydroxyl-kinase
MSAAAAIPSLPPPPPTATRYALSKETELRLEVREGREGAYLYLSAGTAEVFGVELAEGRTYYLAPDRRVGVFTWFGAELLVWGAISGAYESPESQVPVYANLHQQLEARRDAAAAAGGGAQGPRVLVCGSTDSGKSTLCRMLCAYACRVGRAPTLVDLDLGQGEVSIPGSLAATPLDKLCLSVEENFTHTSAMAFYLGHLSPAEHAPVYRNYVERLAGEVNRRQGLTGAGPAGAAGAAARSSGLVINTMGWVEGEGYRLLLDAIRAFSADVVVVLGHDKTFANLRADLAREGGGGGGGAPAPAVELIRLARSGGAVERSRDARKGARAARVKQYFYGPERGGGAPPLLSPELITVGFDDVTVLRVGGAASDAGLVPIGKASALDPLRTATAPMTPAALMNQVLAVTFAGAENRVPHTHVAGFVVVRAVNVAARTLTLLAPCAGALPGKFLLLGNNTWIERE